MTQANNRAAKMPRMGQLETTMIALGYQWFREGDYNLNLVGVRTRDDKANTFNDWLCVAFYFDGRPNFYAFALTTDPGVFYRENPASLDGSAIMVPGQYRGLWQIGLHRGSYLALTQKAPVTVYRDNNKDQVLDMDAPRHHGVYGINCHRANPHRTSHLVDKWSAGCQVLADPDDFELLMALCEQARKRYGNSFTYTLLTEEQLWSH